MKCECGATIPEHKGYKVTPKQGEPFYVCPACVRNGKWIKYTSGAGKVTA